MPTRRATSPAGSDRPADPERPGRHCPARRPLRLPASRSALPASAAKRARYACEVSQSVCPWNTRPAQELQVPELATREFLAGKDARQLARDPLGMAHEEFSRAFNGSPMKRAKPRGLKRNAAVVLSNIGTAEDADLLTAVLDDPEPLVREHAAWALGRLGASAAAVALRACLAEESDSRVRAEVEWALQAVVN